MKSNNDFTIAGYSALQIASVLSCKELSETINPHFHNLAADYARCYQRNGKAFISSFIKFNSIRMACAFIVKSLKYDGSFKQCQGCGKDFSEYANKQNVDDKWKPVLADVLLVIYSAAFLHK